jgi:DNA-binding MarR family transcriptional regulator
MTRLVDRLELRGLVKRRRHAEDRRRVEIELAPAGDTLLGAIRVFKGTPLHVAIDSLTGDQRRRLIAALRELVDATRELTKQEKPD